MANSYLKKVNEFLSNIESTYIIIVIVIGLIFNSISFIVFARARMR